MNREPRRPPVAVGVGSAVNDGRNTRYEIWSLGESGEPHLHGCASGLTFEDACKQLACDSLDFWHHYERGAYRRQKLYPSAAEALEGA